MRCNTPRSLLLAVSLPLMILLGVCAGHAQDANLSANYTWKPVQIGAGGWMRGMAVSASDSTKRYARGDVGQMYRWDDSAQQWVPTEVAGAMPSDVTAAPVGSGNGAGAIGVDPENANHVLVLYSMFRSADISGTYPAPGLEIYYSTDGAQTFKESNLSSLGLYSTGNVVNETSGERIAIDPNNGNVAYYGPMGGVDGNGNEHNDGLYRSTDGGVTWSQVTGSGLPASSSSVRYEFVLPRFDGGSGTVSANGVSSTRDLYVTYTTHTESSSDPVTGSGVVRSTDGGQTWTDISNPNLTNKGNALTFATTDSAGDLWIADGSANIYKYTRSGTWSTSTTPHGGVNGIAVDPNNANRIFVASGGGTLARSLDGGNSWTDLGGSLTFATSQTIQWLEPSSIRPQGHYVSIGGLYMDPSGRLWIPCGNDGILTTMPNDSSDTLSNPPVWTAQAEGIEEMVGQTPVIPPGGDPVLSVEDETLFTITDPDTYTAQHYPINLWNNNNGLSSAMDINYAPNQPKFMAVASDNTFAGVPLNSQFSGYSADGGQTWSLFPSIANGTNPCILYSGSIAISARPAGSVNNGPGNDNIVRIPSNVYSLNSPAPFYSMDGGTTWHQTQSFNNASGAFTGQPCSGSPHNDSTTYTYMGFQWGPWNPSLKQHLLVADPITPGTFYVDLAAGGFWTSADGGVTWTQINNNGLPALAHHGYLVANPGTSGDLWFVDGHEGATAHGLYHSLNGGINFVRNASFDYAWALALGKAAPGQSYPAIYVYGLYHGDSSWGIFQSTDGGNTFNRISYYPYGIFDTPSGLAASWDTFGTLYVSFTGNSFYYATYSAPSGAPDAPTLNATAASGSVSLSWNPNSQGGAPTGYNLYRGTSAGGESSTAIATFNGSTYSYTDTGLTNGTTYYYYLTATNSSGSANSPEVSATPQIGPPTTPTGLTLFPGDGQLSLSWTASAGATGYNIFRGTSSGGESTTPIASNIGETSYTDTGLTDGSTYYYEVQAVSSGGTSSNSSEVSGMPQAPPASAASIAYTSSAPAMNGTVSGVWSNATTYTLGNVIGTIPSGQTNSATWQALWDNTNLYVMATVQDSTVVPGSDGIEVYIDGNNSKQSSYTSLDSQWIFNTGSGSTCSVAAYIGGFNNNPNPTTPSGSACSQELISGGYVIMAQIPWASLGVTAQTKNLIGFDVMVNNYEVAGTRVNKLSWNNPADTDWTTPSAFGTAQLGGTASIAHTSSAPAMNGTVSGVWSNATTYTLGNVIGTIPSGQTNSATWQALWDNTNLYIMATVQDSTVVPGSDGIEVYIDGNNSKQSSYTSLDSQWIFNTGSGSTCSIEAYIQGYNYNPNPTTPSGSACSQELISGGYIIMAQIPWASLGVTGTANNGIGFDVMVNNYEVAGTRVNKLSWNDPVDTDWTTPSAFGTAQLSTTGTGFSNPSDLDIGGPSPAGSAQYSGGGFTVAGSGSDIWNASDQFNFDSVAVTGDQVLVAKVTSITNTDPWAKAGVMLRDTTAADASNAAVVATENNGVSFQWRSGAGNQSFFTNVASIPAPSTSQPVWVKLARAGSVYSAYYSLNGQNWMQVGSSQTVSFSGSNNLAGIAVTSHNNGTLNTATFANVSIQP